MNAPVSHHERARVAALHRSRILDTLPERHVDALAASAAQICGTPMALISLIDATRQWFTATVGITASETARDDAFCAQTVVQSDLLVVPDAKLDARFVDHPWVTGPPGHRGRSADAGGDAQPRDLAPVRGADLGRDRAYAHASGPP